MDNIDANKKLIFWKTAISLQAVDGLKTSAELIQIAKKSIESLVSDEEIIGMASATGNEADLVCARMFLLLAKNEFSLNADCLVGIHKNLFIGISDDAGTFRTKTIAKKEWALEGLAFVYPDYKTIESSLKKLLEKETDFSFEGLTSQKLVHHIATFTAKLWGLHPFARGNTRAIAIFFVEYLSFRGFTITNDVLAKNPIFFRNSLCRAAFSDKGRGIKATPKFLEKLLKNIIFDGTDELDHKAVHLDAKKAGGLLDSEGVQLKETAQSQQSAQSQPGIDPEGVAIKKSIATEKPIATKKSIATKKKSASKSKKVAIESKKQSQVAIDFSKFDPEVKKICDRTGYSCDENAARAIEVLIKEGSATNKSVRKAAGVSTETARRILSGLCDSGIVVAEGKNRTRVYHLAK